MGKQRPKLTANDISPALTSPARTIYGEAPKTTFYDIIVKGKIILGGNVGVWDVNEVESQPAGEPAVNDMQFGTVVCIHIIRRRAEELVSVNKNFSRTNSKVHVIAAGGPAVFEKGHTGRAVQVVQ